VADYFGKEKITEESLRVLKQNVSKAVDEYKKTSQSCTFSIYLEKAPSETAKSIASKQ
jgi:hypothetical protein